MPETEFEKSLAKQIKELVDWIGKLPPEIQKRILQLTGELSKGITTSYEWWTKPRTGMSDLRAEFDSYLELAPWTVQQTVKDITRAMGDEGFGFLSREIKKKWPEREALPEERVPALAPEEREARGLPEWMGRGTLGQRNLAETQRQAMEVAGRIGVTGAEVTAMLSESFAPTEMTKWADIFVTLRGMQSEQEAGWITPEEARAENLRAGMEAARPEAEGLLANAAEVGVEGAVRRILEDPSAYVGEAGLARARTIIGQAGIQKEREKRARAGEWFRADYPQWWQKYQREFQYPEGDEGELSGAEARAAKGAWGEQLAGLEARAARTGSPWVGREATQMREAGYGAGAGFAAGVTPTGQQPSLRNFADWIESQPALMEQIREDEERMFTEYPDLYGEFWKAKPTMTKPLSFAQWIEETPAASAYAKARQAEKARPRQTRIPRWA